MKDVIALKRVKVDQSLDHDLRDDRASEFVDRCPVCGGVPPCHYNIHKDKIVRTYFCAIRFVLVPRGSVIR